VSNLEYYESAITRKVEEEPQDRCRKQARKQLPLSWTYPSFKLIEITLNVQYLEGTFIGELSTLAKLDLI
jgi:hypothetical protein